MKEVVHMTEKEKMQKGMWYDANYDKELLAERLEAEDLCYEFNQTRPKEVEKREGCFAPVKSPETCDSIEEFLKKRDFKSGEHNLRLIAAENCKKGPVKDALLQLAKEGRLKKPEGLNKRDKE